MNITFLRLYLYVPTNRRQTSEFNTSIHCLIGDIFFVTKGIATWAVILLNLSSFEHLHFFNLS